MLPTIAGDHVRYNIALSILASTFFDKVKDEHIYKAVAKKNNILPARSELIEYKGKSILFDVCHNPDGARVFCETLKKYFNSYNRIFILAAMLRNKAYNEMIDEFVKVSFCCTLTTFNYERSFDPNCIAESLKSKIVIIKDPQQALASNLKDMGERDILCVVGSFYFLNVIRKIVTC